MRTSRVLPGRTFARGFVRNYARLVHLDPDLLVAHLPDAAHAPSLESPALHSTGTTMAELPTAHARRAELRPLADSAGAGRLHRRGRRLRVVPRQAARASRRAAAQRRETAPPPAPNASTTPLPNPVAPDAQCAGRCAAAGDRPANSRLPGAGAAGARAASRRRRAPPTAAADATLVLRLRRSVVDRDPRSRRADADLAPGRRRFGRAVRRRAALSTSSSATRGRSRSSIAASRSISRRIRGRTSRGCVLR